MQFRRQTNSEVNVNLTPLIDVVFLLLIFFMVSTTFTKETHIDLDLPQASGEPLVNQPSQLEIVINAQGAYAINGQALVNNQLDTLMAALRDSAENPKDIPLIITADAATPHQAVVTAMDAAGQLGFSRLSLTTMEPAKE